MSICRDRTLAVVLESPVRSGYWPPTGSNRDRDRLVISRKPNLTGPNRYKPVIVGQHQLGSGYITGLKPVMVITSY